MNAAAAAGFALVSADPDAVFRNACAAAVHAKRFLRSVLYALIPPVPLW